MLRLFVAFIAATLLAGFGGAAVAESPAHTKPANAKTVKSSHGRSFGNTVRIHGSSADRPISAAACNERAAALPGSTGTLGPNGASASQTVVAVPIGGGDAATATRRQQIAEACSHVRR